jgi:hypothetical protein
MGTIRLRSEIEHAFNRTYFQQLLAIRLADDVAYQAKARGVLRQLPIVQSLCNTTINALLTDDLAIIKRNVGLPQETTLTAYFPCNRTFEIGFTIH